MKKIDKTKLQFFLGSAFLVAAVAISLANGMALKIEQIFAHSEDGIADSSANNFSEIWTATEIIGDTDGFDSYVADGGTTTFERIRETSTVDSIYNSQAITYDTFIVKGYLGQLIDWGNGASRIQGTPSVDADGITHINWGNNSSYSDLHLRSNLRFAPTKWVINGHLHP